MNDLQQQINEINKRLDSMERSSDIPRNLEVALRERLSVSSSVQGGSPGTAPTTTYTINSVPTSITTGATPSGTIGIIVNGVTYNVYYE